MAGWWAGPSRQAGIKQAGGQSQSCSGGQGRVCLRAGIGAESGQVGGPGSVRGREWGRDGGWGSGAPCPGPSRRRGWEERSEALASLHRRWTPGRVRGRGGGRDWDRAAGGVGRHPGASQAASCSPPGTLGGRLVPGWWPVGGPPRSPGSLSTSLAPHLWKAVRLCHVRFRPHLERGSWLHCLRKGSQPGLRVPWKSQNAAQLPD